MISGEKQEKAMTHPSRKEEIEDVLILISILLGFHYGVIVSSILACLWAFYVYKQRQKQKNKQPPTRSHGGLASRDLLGGD